MKKLIIITLLILFYTDFSSAQKKYTQSKLNLYSSYSSDEGDNLDENAARRRRSRRGRQALFAFGGSLTTMNFFETTFDDKFRFGLGANGWLNLSSSNAVNLNMYYFLPSSDEATDYKNTTSYFLINAHFQQLFIGEHKDDFALYAIAGLGYIINFNSTETADYNIDARFTNICFDIGLGAQFNLNFTFLFTELQSSFGFKKFEIPSNIEDAVNVPSYLNFRAGIKFPLNM